MNKFCLIIFLVSIVNYCFSQTRESDQLEDMINISVEKHLLSKLKGVEEGSISKEFPTDFKFNDSIVRKYNVSFFKVSNFSRKRLKEGIGIFELHFICINKNELLIDISNVHLTKKGNEISIARDMEGGFVIYKFRYSCEKQEWKLVGIRPGYSDVFTMIE